MSDIAPLTTDEAAVYQVLYEEGTEPDMPFEMPFRVADSFSLNLAARSLVDKGLLALLRYDYREGGWIWPRETGTVVTTAGNYVYGPALREAYQAWYESQEDDDGRD